MACPRCGSEHITEEYKLVVCTDCGFVLDDSRLKAEGPGLSSDTGVTSRTPKPQTPADRHPG